MRPTRNHSANISHSFSPALTSNFAAVLGPVISTAAISLPPGGCRLRWHFPKELAEQIGRSVDVVSAFGCKGFLASRLQGFCGWYRLEGSPLDARGRSRTERVKEGNDDKCSRKRQPRKVAVFHTQPFQPGPGNKGLRGD